MSTRSLRIAIVGAGIGGVAAANALLQRGMEVRMFEQASALAEVGAGVALQPNGIRMLRWLGLEDELVKSGARWLDPQFRRMDGTYVAFLCPTEMVSQVEFYGTQPAAISAMLRN